MGKTEHLEDSYIDVTSLLSTLKILKKQDFFKYIKLSAQFTDLENVTVTVWPTFYCHLTGSEEITLLQSDIHILFLSVPLYCSMTKLRWRFQTQINSHIRFLWINEDSFKEYQVQKLWRLFHLIMELKIFLSCIYCSSVFCFCSSLLFLSPQPPYHTEEMVPGQQDTCPESAFMLLILLPCLWECPLMWFRLSEVFTWHIVLTHDVCCR